MNEIRQHAYDIGHEMLQSGEFSEWHGATQGKGRHCISGVKGHQWWIIPFSLSY